MEVNLDLISRYNRAVPRYTSYPTAPHFSDAVGPEEVRDEIAASNAGNERPLSLYLHLPFCRQLCYYCGCHMRVTQRPGVIAKYLDYLKREIDQMALRLNPDREVVQVHWGGGTPTYLLPDQVVDLGQHINRRFRVTADAEISLEADPRGLTPEHLHAARSVGFNRISMGVQDFDSTVQKAINRVQPEAMVRNAVTWARDVGFASINLDLVYGLPHQSTGQFARTVDKVIEIDPGRIALFSYAHMPSMLTHQRLIPDETLPEPSEKLQIFKMAIEKLTGEGGYQFIGMDHFARDNDELSVAQDEGTLHRNFQGYSTHSGTDVYAFGISGINQYQSLYAQNVKGLRDYYKRIDNQELAVYRGYRLTQEDHVHRHVITQLMCHFKLDKFSVERTFDVEFDAYFDDALQQLEALELDGLVSVSGHRVEVQPMGRLLIRNVAACFDAYYRREVSGRQPNYSQSV